MKIERCNLILTYDTAADRIPPIYRYLQKNFFWLQRSIFCGQIGKNGTDRLERQLRPLIDPSYDSVYLFQLRYPFTMEVETWGKTEGAVY
ncbi:CRISPR-associated endonuclease Cas2 [Aminithiophilus ramosus]|uniref:CRISPR-associated endoribonuclease Cas2 n=2 Tax=Synergistales TaxID=649776 RepID=A0A9Q7AD12_9BACT|nr:CRISPR-associated endonuclease Cas2 [Aminithiophilus ramosus]QTX32144.1 CRISPR-associated endonuclease Cas2 [Aminithiophilus ramosus]QVL36012.1 CRISPR-associated endonuclease Cas2 [Synergistota bacterium]